jgi:alkanesulfonate monooxygenase SsuD/methylene tetrahydromethanopterin reductase-like flavin-dependent oxidoreductase (luciferase family)
MPANTLPALALYRDTFRPSATLSRPYAMIATGIICAETDEQARYLAGPSALSFLRLRSGRPGTMPTPEEAEAYPYTDLDRAMIADRQGSQLIGSPDTVREGMAELLKHTQADELMITTMVFDPADRLRSFDLLAEKVLPSVRQGSHASGGLCGLGSAVPGWSGDWLRRIALASGAPRRSRNIAVSRYITLLSAGIVSAIR